MSAPCTAKSSPLSFSCICGTQSRVYENAAVLKKVRCFSMQKTERVRLGSGRLGQVRAGFFSRSESIQVTTKRLLYAVWAGVISFSLQHSSTRAFWSICKQLELLSLPLDRESKETFHFSGSLTSDVTRSSSAIFG